MKKADQKIISDNPKISPHDLLTMHGLSQQGFEELVAMGDKQGSLAQEARPPKKLVPQGIIKQPIIPVLSQPGREPISEDKVRLIPPNGGTGTIMNRIPAEALARRNKKYKIIRNG